MSERTTRPRLGEDCWSRGLPSAVLPVSAAVGSQPSDGSSLGGCTQNRAASGRRQSAFPRIATACVQEQRGGFGLLLRGSATPAARGLPASRLTSRPGRRHHSRNDGQPCFSGRPRTAAGSAQTPAGKTRRAAEWFSSQGNPAPARSKGFLRVLPGPNILRRAPGARRSDVLRVQPPAPTACGRRWNM